MAVPRGLRPRLVLAFVLVALASGLGATAVSYVAARTAVLADAQDAVLERTRDDLNRIAPTLLLPPDQRTLDQINAALPQGGLVVYGRLRSPRDARVAPEVPAELRRAVAQQDRLLWQRVDGPDGPSIAIGTPILTETGQRSGIEVYLLSSLVPQEQRVEALAASAARTTALSLLAAVALALVAARGVLRPVRALTTAARRLAAGELDTRLRVRGSDELADLTLTFNNTAADLERSVEELRRMEGNARRFVADVSHELRTPLAAMTAVTDTLDEEAAQLDGDAGTAARLISTETRRLAQLVENLIELSRFDAGRATLRVDEQVDLAAAIPATLAARGWTDDVTTVLPPGLTAELDRPRLDVIVANLVGNALRHGGAPVRVEVGGDADWVTVTVTDGGPGLPPDVAPYIFERFYKGDAARTRSEGSGLGLAIAGENARLHGGTIEASNGSTGGAAFTLRLPRRQPISGVRG